MKTFSAILFAFLISILTINQALAVPAYPYPVKITQPDGSELTIRLHGDEYFNYKTTLDGYTLVQDAKGYLTYATSDANGNLVSTDIKATNIERRSAQVKKFLKNLTPNVDFSRRNQLNRLMRAPQSGTSTASTKTYPLNGTPKSIVILVNFSDLSFVTSNSKTAFTNLLNKNGYSDNYATGSARDYFRDNSMGVFSPQFDVVGPYTLPQIMSYYGGNDLTSDQDVNPRQMVIDACALAAADGVNFAQYDTDNNGVVDNVFIYYAGYNEAEGAAKTTIWPHRWTLSNKNTVFNGKAIYDYACTSELRSRAGATMCGVGTFVHEFGHVLGLPDYYATNGANHHTLSYWNVMDAGPYLNDGRTPPSYSAYDRFYLDWLKPVEIETPGDYSLDTLSTSNKAYIITQNGNHNLIGSAPSPAEFFTLENRQNKGWDAYLPGHGLMITHVYFNLSAWQSNTPNNDPNTMGYDIIEADNSATDNTLSSDLYPGTYNVSTYNPRLRDNSDIRKPLAGIKETNGKIYFSFGTKITVTGTLLPFSTVQGTPSAIQSVTVNGKKLKDLLQITFNTGTHFQVKKQTDPETSWGTSITLTPVDSIVANTVIQVRYNPTIPSYTINHADVLSFKSGTDAFELSLTGSSTRPIYVIPPVATTPTELSFFGYKANWNNVSDATGYYLTIYNLSDGESTLTEGFDNGLTAPTNWTITAKNTSSSTIYSGLKVPSIQFSNTGEYIQTEKYMLPPASLSFYLRSMGGNNGGFLVEGFSELNGWKKIDSLSVTSSLLEKNKTYTLDVSKAYVCFRFTYTKGIGSVTFDDVTVKFTKQLSYVERDKWTTENSETLTGLKPNTEYVYKVKASDKNTVYKYENITEFSNTITVNTLAYPIQKGLLVTKNEAGDITVFLPSSDTNIYIYNTIGQIVRIITPETNTVVITDLPRNQIYIIRANDRKAKINI